MSTKEISQAANVVYGKPLVKSDTIISKKKLL